MLNECSRSGVSAAFAVRGGLVVREVQEAFQTGPECAKALRRKMKCCFFFSSRNCIACQERVVEGVGADLSTFWVTSLV